MTSQADHEPDTHNLQWEEDPHHNPQDHAEIDATWEDSLPTLARERQANPVLLETRGVTSHFRPGEFWDATLIHKRSIAAKLREAGDYERAHELDDCHSSQMVAVCRGCEKARPFWNRCDRFYCPTCQPRLARERRTSVEWWIQSVKQPKHLVLTIPNLDQISKDDVRWLKACLTRLRRSRAAANWKGGLYSLEVTNRGHGWHPHFHLIVDTAWIDKPLLEATWARIIGHPFSVIHVTDARRKDYAAEVCKYVVKGSMMAAWTPAETLQFIQALEGSRSFGVFGSLYGKRTEWREFLETLATKYSICDCGCNRWRILSLNEWQWEQHTKDPVTQTRPPPAPVSAQFEFPV